jgi:glycosyltransferase involved in cell wall biosynthesis
VLQPLPPRNTLHARLVAADVPVIFLHAQHTWQACRVVWQLWQQWRQWQPDVVHSWLYHANVLGTIAARLAQVPRILVGLRVADPQPGRLRVERKVYRWASELISVSQAVRWQYAQLIPRAHHRVIPNAIDAASSQHASPVSLAAWGLADDTPLLLCAGRLHPQKGFDWLLRCLPALLARVPHHVVIAGEGPERESLQRQARGMGLSSRVHFIGYRHDLAAWLTHADLFLLSSRYEGMANVVLEAMAQGTPVVATRVAGSEELLGPHAEQLTIPFGDDRGLIEKVVALLADPAERRALGKQLQARAEHCFSWNAVLPAYAAAWRGDEPSSSRQAVP